MDYYDFLPPPVIAGAAVGISKLTSKKRSKRYLNSQTQELSNRFPAANDSATQEKNIGTIESERNRLELERSTARARKTRLSLDARLAAYNEYLRDAQEHLTELKQLEAQKAQEEAAAKAAADAAKAAEADKAAPTPDIVTSTGPASVADAVKGDAVLESAQPQSAKKSTTNYLLIGGVVLVAVLLLTRKR